MEFNLINYKENTNLINLINNKNKFIAIFDYISLIKIISSCLVILKHTNENYWVYNEYWISTNVMCSFCMCAVPLFALCIGATLLNFNERYGIKEYWKRRIIKIIIPIIGWNIVYYFYRVYLLKNFEKIQFNFINIYKIYFYNQLYPIIGSLRIFVFGYILIPILTYIEKSNKIKIYSYGLIIIIINNSTIPYLLKTLPQFKIILNHFGTNFDIYWPYNFESGYTAYLFAGFIIHNYRFNKIFKYFFYIFGIVGLFLRLLISHHLTIKYKIPDSTQINYLNLPIVIYSCSIFLFIKENSKYLFKYINKKIINKIGALSMGPFFLHYMIIWTLPHLFKYNKFGFNYRFFGFIIISFLCFILTSLIKKIPIIKYLTP